MAILKNTTISGTYNLTLTPGATSTRPEIITSIIKWSNTGSQSYSVLTGPTPTLTNTSWTAPTGVTQVEVLVVAGGGGGGYNGGGGGGAGGVIYNNAYNVTPGSTYTVTVGTGGAGSSASVNLASNGNNSVFDALTAIGGGGGNSRSVTGSILTGGSGGGGASATGSASQAAGAGTSGQGTSGGAGTAADLGANAAGGGGGGAGQAGQAGSYQLAGGGGHGLNFAITGVNTWYAGGGAGGTCVNGVNPAQGGLGGGGAGGISTSANGVSGTAGTGGGGGGGNGSGTTGTGGSGVVILRYSVLSDNTNPLGIMRYNSDLKAVEVYEGTSTGWISQDPNRNFGGHNLIIGSDLYGSQLSAEAIWTITNNSTDVTAPNGTAYTTKGATGSTGNSYFWRYSPVSYTVGETYTHSVYIRTNSGTGSLTLSAYPFGQTTVTVTSTWTRFSTTFVVTSGTSPYISVVSPSINTTFYFWGWSVEKASSAGPYVSTNTAASPVPTSLGGYRYHTYTTVGSSGFSPAVTGMVEVLVVAGGGAGGRNGTVDGSGGGGAGGVLYTQAYPVTANQQYTVVVGAGGVGVASPNTPSNNGDQSQFDMLVAIGGGRGGGEDAIRTGGQGGSGGGAGGYAQKPGGRGIDGQGFPGGYCHGPGDGGGGGAGGPGGGGLTGTGGHGRYFPQFASVGGYPAGWFGGGGGASGDSRNARGTGAGRGGLGGGGNGAPATTGGTAVSGVANTGGGGGGAAGSGNGTYPSVGSVIAPGSGGSGIVIVRYRYD